MTCMRCYGTVLVVLQVYNAPTSTSIIKDTDLRIQVHHSMPHSCRIEHMRDVCTHEVPGRNNPRLGWGCRWLHIQHHASEDTPGEYQRNLDSNTSCFCQARWKSKCVQHVERDAMVQCNTHHCHVEQGKPPLQRRK